MAELGMEKWRPLLGTDSPSSLEDQDSTGRRGGNLRHFISISQLLSAFSYSPTFEFTTRDHSFPTSGEIKHAFSIYKN